MKKLILLTSLIISVFCLNAQNNKPTEQQKKSITELIDQYSLAREKSDTVLLKKILTSDIDQLVSNGEWRDGMQSAIQGMLKSSEGSPGTRTLKVEKIKMLNAGCAITDCRYEIQNTDGSIRKMWSSFIAVMENGKWRISSIRNMLPSPQ